MSDYSVKVQNRFATLLEPPEKESKPKSKKKTKTPANNTPESKEGKSAASLSTEKAASTHSANLPSNAHTKESTKPEPVDISSSNNKTIHQQHQVEPPVENNSSSSKSGSFNNRNGGNNNRLQNERKFEGNDHSGNHSFNNNTNYNKPERNQQRHVISQVDEVPSNDAASAVFSNNAPIPQWEDFSANTKKENKNDHLSNGFMRNEFPQVEEFRPDNLDPKNQEGDRSYQRNAGGFGSSRPRGGNFRGRGPRGAFRGRTFSRGGGGGGGFGTFRNDRPPPNFEGGENNYNNDIDNNQECGNENGGGAGFGRGGFYGNRRGNYFDSRFSWGRGGGSNRRYNNYRQSSDKYFDKRRPFDRPHRDERDAQNNEQERVAQQNGDGVYTGQHQNATDGEQVTNGAEVNGGGGYDQKNPVSIFGGGGEAAPQEEIVDWNAEVEKEEARRKETGEPAPGASEESAFMSLEDFEAAQKEKQRNTSFDVRKPGEGVNQFEGMRKINSSKVNEPSSSNTYPNNPLSSEPATQLNKGNSSRVTKQNKLDIHFGPAPAKSAQTSRSGSDRGSFGGRGGGGYNDRGYGGYGGRGRGPRRGGSGGGGGPGGPNFSDNRRANYEGPAPTFNNDADFPILGEN